MLWVLYLALIGLSLSFHSPSHRVRVWVLSNRRTGSHIHSELRMNQEIDLKTALLNHINLVSKSPFVITPSDTFILDPNITFSTDVISGSGDYLYADMVKQWTEEFMSELSEATFTIDQITYIQKDALGIKWNVTFIPESISSIVRFARSIPFWKVKFIDVLDRERFQSRFSWKAFGLFLERALFKGEVRLSHAVIVGSTDLVFLPISADPIATGSADELTTGYLENKSNNENANNEFARNNNQVPNMNSKVAAIRNEMSSSSSTESRIPSTLNSARPQRWVLKSSKETLNLVRSIDKGLLKNRKLATDLLEFLDARKPLVMGLREWNDVLNQRINTRAVPGMSQFDIDGLETEQQADAIEGVSKVLGLFTGLVLISGVVFGTITMNKVFSYRESHDKSKVLGKLPTSIEEIDDSLL